MKNITTFILRTTNFRCGELRSLGCSRPHSWLGARSGWNQELEFFFFFFLWLSVVLVYLFKNFLFYCGKNMQHEIYLHKILSIQYSSDDYSCDAVQQIYRAYSSQLKCMPVDQWLLISPYPESLASESPLFDSVKLTLLDSSCERFFAYCTFSSF